MIKKIFLLSCMIFFLYSCTKEKLNSTPIIISTGRIYLISFDKYESTSRSDSLPMLTRESLRALPVKNIKDLIENIQENNSGSILSIDGGPNYSDLKAQRVVKQKWLSKVKN